ncbi:patatin-like phospholipase family protein [uncultured Sulfitobacter sp.]|uniref:patatin-like phospholipase family protein n=1 Tax=uncultured Sulfitobacter sp. TaxID=191468 RepID=UPI00263222A7|nr:patatin-like phospholipase family protein [uncultured Sulfitobacter sp.]
MGLFLAGMTALAVIILLAAVIYGFIVPLKVHFRTDLADTRGSLAEQGDKPFVGLALSGGGARAAVFAAAGMEALHKRGMLDQITHVSSVSGGGFAASYLALHPVETDARAYFKRMQSVMAHDFFWDVQMNQLRRPSRAFSPSRRLVSLQDALNRQDFLDGAVFGHLPKDRTFFFNSVSYDTGRRFVFSNGTLPPHDADDTVALPSALRSLSFSGGENLRATPNEVPLSLAVATSAAFPPYLGPTTIQIEGRNAQADEYWHLGDGGVVENTGIETLREAIYARGDKRQAVIYVFNAGQRLNSELSRKSADISIWSREVTRLVDVLLEYATAHRETMSAELDAKNGMDIRVIEFDYLAISKAAASGAPAFAHWLTWDGWYYSTHADRMASKTPAEHLVKVPTALKITACDRQLVAQAAADLVAQHFDPVRS